MPPYELIFLASWAAFVAVWIVFAFDVKRDIRGGRAGLWRSLWFFRIAAAALIVFALVRMSKGAAHYTASPVLVLSRGIFPQIPALDWTAAALTAVGAGFAIWARVCLGRNWSPSPAVKERHELVTSGPYAYVRHPIYTGILLMAFAAALTGSFWGIGILAFVVIVFILRIGKEERIMLELFPDAYPAYRKRTKALIPFVL